MKVSELKSILENMSDYDDVTVNGKLVEAVEMKQDMSFLSRLCGGELDHRKLTDSPMFLSRLCGGERDRWNGDFE